MTRRNVARLKRRSAMPARRAYRLMSSVNMLATRLDARRRRRRPRGPWPSPNLGKSAWATIGCRAPRVSSARILRRRGTTSTRAQKVFASARNSPRRVTRRTGPRLCTAAPSRGAFPRRMAARRRKCSTRVTVKGTPCAVLCRATLSTRRVRRAWPGPGAAARTPSPANPHAPVLVWPNTVLRTRNPSCA